MVAEILGLFYLVTRCFLDLKCRSLIALVLQGIILIIAFYIAALSCPLKIVLL